MSGYGSVSPRNETGTPLRPGRAAWFSASVAVLMLFFAAGNCAADTLERSLLRVIVTCQFYDPFMPWQKSAPGVRAGYGYVIDENRVITTEDLVRNQTLVELQPSLSGEKYTATVELSDETANLAILRISDPNGLKGLVPLELAEKVAKDSKVAIVQFDETGGISHGNGQVVEISVADIPQSPGSLLAFKVLTDLNVNGHGAVALCEGKVAGLIMAYDRNTRIGTMLPYPVLGHFISDAARKTYRGFASAGFGWSPLVDPAERKFLKVGRDDGGVVVLWIAPDTGAAAALKPQDVVIEWDGRAIDKLGFYIDPDFGRLALPYLIKGRRYPGDTVMAKLIRNGEPITVGIKLTRQLDRQSLIPENTAGLQAEYLADGGLVIREITGDYLRVHGNPWNLQTDSRLVHIYMTRAGKPERVGDRVVVLSHILPDPINLGYQHFRDQIITCVNGEPVRNISDVFKLVKRDGGLKRIRLQSMGVDLVLDQTAMKSANTRLMRSYQIPQMRFQREDGATRPPSSGAVPD